MTSLLSGIWQGSGQSTINPGTKNEHIRNCSEIGVQLNVNETKLNWLNGHYICEDLQAEYDPTDFDLKNGKIYLKQNEVGTYQDNKISLAILDPSDESTFNLELLYVEGKVQYHEKWYESSNLKMQVDGELSKVSK